MLFYLDTSIAIRAIDGAPENAAVVDWLEACPDNSIVSSRLLRTELIRYLRRDDIPLEDGEPIFDAVSLIEPSVVTFNVAEGILPHIKTLDAIHLATALTIGEPVTVISHDANMLKVAKELGLPTFNPVAA